MKLWVPVVKFSLKPVIIGQSQAKKKKPAAKPQKFNYKRWLWPAAAVILLIIIGSWFWRSLGSPGHGDIALISPDTTSQTKLPEYTTLTTNFYSLDYSERYSQVPTDIAPAGFLDQKILSYKLGGQPGQTKIEIGIKAAPDGGITLDSTYIYYVSHQKQFKLSSKYYHGEAIDIARSQNSTPSETAALWLHNGFLMIIKIVTSDPNQNIDSELKDILSSVQWRDS